MRLSKKVDDLFFYYFNLTKIIKLGPIKNRTKKNVNVINYTIV